MSEVQPPGAPPRELADELSLPTEVGAVEEEAPAAAPPPVKTPRFELSPMNRRRLENFRRNRRGYWSFWIFLALFTASMFSEFLANDRE